MSPPPPPADGVILFNAHHAPRPLADFWREHIGDPLCGLGALTEELARWRAALIDAGLVGQDPARYGGGGFGDLSARLPGAAGAAGAFLVTGTQTSGLGHLGGRALSAHLCAVLSVDLPANAARSEGPARPSSEAMTHAALYAASPEVMWVFHGHAPLLWRAAGRLGLPVTPAEVGYGTPEMAAAAAGLWGAGRWGLGGVLAMGGHEDGVVCAGREAREAGEGLLAALRLCGGAS